MPRRDLEEKTVLDLKCGIGSRCFLACQAGAKEVLGLDSHYGLISAAVRLNSYFAQPVDFLVHDLGKGPADVAPRETVLLLDPPGRDGRSDVPAEMIRELTERVLYFGGSPDDHPELFDGNFFHSVEMISSANVQGTKIHPDGPVYRCEVRT
jgi:SAM-dependent methyltransferase